MNLSYRHLPRMISDLIFFLDHSTKFDGKVIDSIISYYEKHGKVSAFQFHALASTYEKWFVKEFVDRKKARNPDDFYHFDENESDDF